MFFNNYSKPGPGVDKSVLNKKGVSLVTDVFSRKFFQLIKMNFIYFLISIPFFVIALFALAPQVTNFVVGSELIESNVETAFILNLSFAAVIFNLFGSGPVSASYSYIARAFVKSQPIWMLSDGFDKFKENFKKSMILVIVDIIVVLLSFAALRFYSMRTEIFSHIAFVIILCIFSIYAMAHIFIYQIMVTYECSFIGMLKSSVLFTMAKLPVCILFAALTGVGCFLLFGYLGIISVIIYSTIGMSLFKFPLEFYAIRVIQKNIENTHEK